MLAVVQLSLIDGKVGLALPIVDVLGDIVNRLDDAFHSLQDPGRLTRSNRRGQRRQ